MHVNEIMSKRVITVVPEATLEEGARRMREWDVGILPVSEDGKRVIGVVTDRDVVIRGMADGHDPKNSSIQQVMTPEVVCCLESQDVAEAAHLMKEKHIRRLMVLNQDSQIVGVLSLGDLARTAGTDVAFEVLKEAASK